MSSILPSLSPSRSTAVMPRMCAASSTVGTVALLCLVGMRRGSGDVIALAAAIAGPVGAVRDNGGVAPASLVVAARHERGQDAEGRQRDVQDVVRAVDGDDS